MAAGELKEEERQLLLLCCRMHDGLLPLNRGQYEALRPFLQGETPLEALIPDAESRVRVRTLLEREKKLDTALTQWGSAGIEICTIFSRDYPAPVAEKLGNGAPAALFLLGDRSLLAAEAVSLVGSRELREKNRVFAEYIGTAAAERGLALCSGDARGADRAGQSACRSAGGRVVSFVADRLMDRDRTERVLYISEDGPDFAFSTPRALSRNRLIHTFGRRVYVAQTSDGHGGTWSGTKMNLVHGWSPVFVYDDGTRGAAGLLALGAERAENSGKAAPIAKF